MEIKNKIEENKSFWNKKTITLIVISLVLLILASVLVSIFFLGIDFNFINTLSKKHFTSDKISYLFGLLFSLLFIWIWNGAYSLISAAQFGLKLKWYEFISFCIMCVLINNITPFAIGSEAYKIYYFKIKGLTTKQATLAVSSTAIFFSLAQIIITWPSFIYFCIHYNTIVSNGGVVAFWLTFFGLIVDLTVFIVMLTLSFSRRVHVFISSIFNKILKILKKPYKDKEQIIYEYQTNSWFREAYIKEMKKITQVLILLFCTILYACLSYFSMFFSFRLLGYNESIFSFINLFNLTNVSVTANNYVPIPGGEGTIQILMKKFIYVWSSTDKTLTNEYINNAIDESIFVWRSFLFYLPTIIGIGWAPFAFWYQIKHNKK